jgi:hypothetical protein
LSAQYFTADFPLSRQALTRSAHIDAFAMRANMRVGEERRYDVLRAANTGVLLRVWWAQRRRQR